jgi:hypothetical protein
MQSINGCAFCRANRKSWTNHTAEICVELANCVCGYCKEKGHTPKRCPKSALKRHRKLYTIHESKAKATWASLVLKSLTTEARNAIELKHKENKQKEAEERRKKYEERQQKKVLDTIKAERYYVYKMRRDYGIEDSDIGQGGDFWFFFVESTKNDSNMAKVLREKEGNQFRFRNYLLEKYWVNWLSQTAYTEDDCPILYRWRNEELKREYEQDKLERKRIQECIKTEEDLEAVMAAKLEAGEITQEEFALWKWQKQLDEDSDYQAEADIWWTIPSEKVVSYDVWKKRSEARKSR